MALEAGEHLRAAEVGVWHRLGDRGVRKDERTESAVDSGASHEHLERVRGGVDPVSFTGSHHPTVSSPYARRCLPCAESMYSVHCSYPAQSRIVAVIASSWSRLVGMRYAPPDGGAPARRSAVPT